MSHKTKKAAGSHAGRDIHRKKRAAALLTLAFALCLFPAAAYAEEPQMTAESGQAAGLRAAARENPRSRGSLVYQEGKKQAEVFAEDFLLLNNKLATIPEEVFDPVLYTHAHRWEYRNVNEKTHTRHCGICGDAFDLEYTHSVSHEEAYTIRHGGGEYPGRRYRCACGWQWEQEASHVIVFETVDGTSHRSRCLLEDTAFCRGLEPVTEEHYAYRHEPCADGAHHMKICIDCGYEEGKETCDFTLKVNPDEEDDRDPALLYCICGNGKAAGNGEDQTPEQPDEYEKEPSGEKTGTDEPGEPPAEEPGTDGPGEPSAEEPGTDKPDEPSAGESEADGPEEPSVEEPGTDEPEEPSAGETGTDEPEEPSGEKLGTGESGGTADGLSTEDAATGICVENIGRTAQKNFYGNINGIIQKIIGRQS